MQWTHAERLFKEFIEACGEDYRDSAGYLTPRLSHHSPRFTRKKRFNPNEGKRYETVSVICFDSGQPKVKTFEVPWQQHRKTVEGTRRPPADPNAEFMRDRKFMKNLRRWAANMLESFGFFEINGQGTDMSEVMHTFATREYRKERAGKRISAEDLESYAIEYIYRYADVWMNRNPEVIKKFGKYYWPAYRRMLNEQLIPDYRKRARALGEKRSNTETFEPGVTDAYIRGSIHDRTCGRHTPACEVEDESEFAEKAVMAGVNGDRVIS